MRSHVPRGQAVVGALVALAAGVLVAGVLAACGGDGEAEGTDGRAETAIVETRRLPDPKDLVPRLSDLPSGYVIDASDTGSVSLADELEFAEGEEASLLEEEFVSGYSIGFESTEELAMESPQYLSCEATVFRSSGGAQQVFGLRLDAFEENPFGDFAEEFESVEVEPVSIDERLGDENHAFVMVTGLFSGFTVSWRDDMLLGLCVAAGVVSVELSDPVIELAQAQQARFARALT